MLVIQLSANADTLNLSAAIGLTANTPRFFLFESHPF